MNSRKYRLTKVKKLNPYENPYENQSVDEGPFIITVKTMTGDLLVLETGNGSDVKYDEETDKLYTLYKKIAHTFTRVDEKVFNNKTDMKELGLMRKRSPQSPHVAVTEFEIQLLDADSTEQKENELTASVFNYLGEEYKRNYFGPVGFDTKDNKFKCRKNGRVVDTPLPRRNLNLYLLISEEALPYW